MYIIQGSLLQIIKPTLTGIRRKGLTTGIRQFKNMWGNQITKVICHGVETDAKAYLETVSIPETSQCH